MSIGSELAFKAALNEVGRRHEKMETEIRAAYGKVDGLIDGMLDAVNKVNAAVNKVNARINALEARCKALEDARPRA